MSTHFAVLGPLRCLLTFSLLFSEQKCNITGRVNIVGHGATCISIPQPLFRFQAFNAHLKILKCDVILFSLSPNMTIIHYHYHSFILSWQKRKNLIKNPNILVTMLVTNMLIKANCPT